MTPSPSAIWHPTSTDFQEARQRIEGYVVRTPLLRASPLDRNDWRVFIKTENLQRTGSFKVRGAFNALLRLSEEQRARGVITHSSGNFAQALALAAREVGCSLRGRPYPCTVVMPQNANPLKQERTRSLGAHIEFAGNESEDREIRARQMAEDLGLPLIPSYDHPDIILGQGTIGLEILEQLRILDLQPAAVVGPVGGGGLFGGTASVMRAEGYEGALIGVEPESGDDTLQSLKAGKAVRIKAPETICDGLCSVIPGRFTLPLMARSGVHMATAGEAEIKAACYRLLEDQKLLVEPSGSITVAAWLSGRLNPFLPSEGQGVIVLILSGGNCDPSLVSSWNR